MENAYTLGGRVIRQGGKAAMTAQIGDRLFYKGEKHWMETYPLGQYLRTRDDIHFDSATCWSSCHRGYIGSWEIIDNKLFLIGLVEGTVCDPEDPEKVEIDLGYIFPNVCAPNQERVFASWYTGHMCAPFGKILARARFHCIFEKELCFEVENGIIVHEEEIDNNDLEKAIVRRMERSSPGIMERIDVLQRLDGLKPIEDFLEYFHYRRVG